jgi:hypothetical protein
MELITRLSCAVEDLASNRQDSFLPAPKAYSHRSMSPLGESWRALRTSARFGIANILPPVVERGLKFKDQSGVDVGKVDAF